MRRSNGVASVSWDSAAAALPLPAAPSPPAPPSSLPSRSLSPHAHQSSWCDVSLAMEHVRVRCAQQTAAMGLQLRLAAGIYESRSQC